MKLYVILLSLLSSLLMVQATPTVELVTNCYF